VRKVYYRPIISGIGIALDVISLSNYSHCNVLVYCWDWFCHSSQPRMADVWNFCFEMVHFGAKVTNAVHRHWFSGSGCNSKNTDLRLVKFLS